MLLKKTHFYDRTLTEQSDLHRVAYQCLMLDKANKAKQASNDSFVWIRLVANGYLEVMRRSSMHLGAECSLG